MWTNTKLLVIVSTLIVLAGFSLLWFGTNFTQESLPAASPKTSQAIGNSVVANESAAPGLEGEQVLVTRVIDGDTIQIEGKVAIRLIGIDTPETKDPRKSVQCFGKEASNKTKDLLLGKMVILEKDVSETDKYKRLLRYVFLPLNDDQLLFVNDYLIREGFAKALTYPPDVKYTEQFLQAQREAKIEKRGLWSRC